MRNFLLALAALMMLAVACVPQSPTGDAVTNTTDNATGNASGIIVNETTPPDVVPGNATETQGVPQNDAPTSRFTVEGTEGDLIKLRPQALDPDGDTLTYTFTAPFDRQGNWQTAIGDEGSHDVVVGVSDGKSETVETIRVIVHRANRAPTVVCGEIVVREGEIVDLHKGCDISDEDNDDVLVTYGGWMGGWRYQATYDDAGTHIVTITASDKDRNDTTLHTVVRNVTVTVENVNRPPVFNDSFPTQITATENDVITLPRELIVDPDGDPITITYGSPVGSDGIWKTKIGDAGTYNIDVVATDGSESVKRTIQVVVKMLNTPPVLKTIPDITVKEGETIKLPISAYDREGDALITTISGWMTTDTYKTTYEDAGSYTVTVTITDGVYTTKQIVHITVIDVNRPPVFVTPA